MSTDELLKSLSEVDGSLLWLAVFALTFALEEGAAVLAATLHLSDRLTLLPALTAVYIGVLASDASLYGIGAAARRFSWANRWFDSEQVLRAGRWMGPRMTYAIAMCRVLPWSLPPVFIACGFLKLPFWRFMWASAWTGALWTAAIMGGLLGGGSLLMRLHLGWVGWLFVAMACVLAWRGFQRIQRQAFGQGLPTAISSPSPAGSRTSFQLPQPGANWFGYLPSLLFYVPVIVMWLLLAVRYRSITLPTAANPSFESGGFVGESKDQVMQQVRPSAKDWFAPWVTLQRTQGDSGLQQDLSQALAAMGQVGLSFPIVAKPDRGHHGHGVHPVQNETELRSYLHGFPPGEQLQLQRMVDMDFEAGVFYARLPGRSKGKIISLNFSEAAFVRGDGKSSLRELIESCPGLARCKPLHLSRQAHRLEWVPPDHEHVQLAFARSLRLGATLIDGRQHITDALTERFDRISEGIEGFYFGRFDLRFQHLSEFERGEGFQILELNGAGAEANHIWDPRAKLHDAYFTLFRQYRLAFHIGSLNRAQGHRPMGASALWRSFMDQRRRFKSHQAQSDKAGVAA